MDAVQSWPPPGDLKAAPEGVITLDVLAVKDGEVHVIIARSFRGEGGLRPREANRAGGKIVVLT